MFLVGTASHKAYYMYAKVRNVITNLQIVFRNSIPCFTVAPGTMRRIIAVITTSAIVNTTLIIITASAFVISLGAVHCTITHTLMIQAMLQNARQSINKLLL